MINIDTQKWNGFSNRLATWMMRARQLGKQRVHVEFSQLWVHLLTPQSAVKPDMLYRCIRRHPNDEVAPWPAGNVQLPLDLILILVCDIQVKLPVSVS